MKFRQERPYKRVNPSGKVVWVGRYSRPDGTVGYAKPAWNGFKSTFALKSDAQRAINEAYDLPTIRDTVGGYAGSWTRRRPRSTETNETNDRRLDAVLDVRLDGRPFAEWCFDELRRRQVNDLVDHMLREQGRAITGVRGILSVLSSMCEDAIDDEVAGDNPFKGIRLRSNDPRIQKAPREIRVWTFDQIRAFAVGGRPEVRARTPRPDRNRPQRRPGAPGPKPAERFYAPHDYEALILTIGLTGLRLGEVFALQRSAYDGATLTAAGSASDHGIVGSSREKNHDRIVPAPPSLAAVIDRMPPRIDSALLFPAPKGGVWKKRNFYRDVWEAAKRATGMDPTPHEFRHSYVSELRAAGIDDADLAEVAGHSVETMLSRYTHGLGRSHDRIRKAIG